MIITQNGAAKAVIQDVASYEETQGALALLKDSGARQPTG
jgi:prevent-host-death family protein